MWWQPPQAEVHFTLFFLQGHLLVMQSPEQLQKTNCSKFAVLQNHLTVADYWGRWLLLLLAHCICKNVVWIILQACYIWTEKSIFQHCWCLQWKLHYSKTQNISFGFHFLVYINIKVVDQNNKNICIFSNNTSVTSQGIVETSFHNCCFCIIPTANAANVGNAKFCWYRGHQCTLIWTVWKKLSFHCVWNQSFLTLMSWQNYFWHQRLLWSLIEFSYPSKRTTVLFADLPRYLTLAQYLFMISGVFSDQMRGRVQYGCPN